MNAHLTAAFAARRRAPVAILGTEGAGQSVGRNAVSEHEGRAVNPTARLAVGVIIRVLAYIGLLAILAWLLIVGVLWVLTGGGKSLAELGVAANQHSAHFTEDVVLSRDRLLVIREITATVDPRGEPLVGIAVQGGMSVIEGSKNDVWVAVLDRVTKVQLGSPGFEGILIDNFPHDCLATACSRTYVLAACLLTTESDARVAIYASGHLTVTGSGERQPPADVKLERVPLDLDPSWNDLITTKTNGRCPGTP